jgi:hypothetical protein
LRDPNAIDFWRGFALITIFINHVPGNAYERFTYSGYILSDAAELFVFLAGWSLALATQAKTTPDRPAQVILRVASRTLEVYRVQIVITVLAIAIIAAAAVYLDNPLLLEWHNAGPFFSDPVQTSIGLVLLTYQLGYFNILPLYVVLWPSLRSFILLARWMPWLALALSASIYAAALILEVNLPNWPGDGHWFFNPLAWQFLLVLGFVMSLWAHSNASFRAWAGYLIPLGAVGVALGWASVMWDLKPDPYSVPSLAFCSCSTSRSCRLRGCWSFSLWYWPFIGFTRWSSGCSAGSSAPSRNSDAIPWKCSRSAQCCRSLGNSFARRFSPTSPWTHF